MQQRCKYRDSSMEYGASHGARPASVVVAASVVVDCIPLSHTQPEVHSRYEPLAILQHLHIGDMLTCDLYSSGHISPSTLYWIVTSSGYTT